jgi:uncharacterized metal-binding protein YceD (DUF177 family)
MESFQILVDRLKGGQTLKISESFDPAFLEIAEEELRFDAPVVVKGEAYLTEDELILHLKAATEAEMPCAICNKMIRRKLSIGDFYHAQPLKEIPGAIFDYKETLREALLIEVPQYVECGGKCPERSSIAPYMRAEQRVEKTYFPFKDLDS